MSWAKTVTVPAGQTSSDVLDIRGYKIVQVGTTDTIFAASWTLHVSPDGTNFSPAKNITSSTNEFIPTVRIVGDYAKIVLSATQAANKTFYIYALPINSNF